VKDVGKPYVSAVALGYQGFGNVGDEAILTGIETLLQDGPVRVTTVICGPQTVHAFASAARIRTRRMRPNLAAIRAMRQSRLLLMSGGGLLHDHWWTVIPTYLAWVLAARALGLRVAWLGVGIGPLRSRRSKILSALTLRLSHVVSVRDDESAALVREIASGIDVVIIPDPAMFNPPPVGGDREGVGVIVRRPAPRDARATEGLAEALGAAVARLHAQGTPVELVTFGGSADEPFAELVAERAAATGGTRPSTVALAPHPDAAISRLARYEALISVRLHGLILGALAGTPTVSVSYDPKVAAWAARLGLSDYCLPMEPLSTAGLLAAFDRMRADPGMQHRLTQRVSAIRAEADSVRNLLIHLFQT
jgi:polysaccharide pyruvyl transferase CsaB